MLRRAGWKAHLDLDTCDGQAWIGLRVMLSPNHHQEASNVKRRSPSYYRRQERRKAARIAAEKPILEEADAHGFVVAEEASEAVKAKENENVIAAERSKSDQVHNCEVCDFISNSENGLTIHMSKKHARIEQLDGSTSFSEESDDPYVQNEIENYLATGEISCQNFIFNTVCEELFNVIKSSNLSVSEKKKELLKAVEA